MTDQPTDPPRGWLKVALASDMVDDFLRSPATVVAALLFVTIAAAAFLAPWVAPYDPFDPAASNVVDARLPPASEGLFGGYFLLGTDPQGRDILSVILYGTRTSLVVGLAAVGFAALVGVTLGLLAGYAGGLVDVAIMRIADVQLSFPAILIALLVDGIARNALSSDLHSEFAIPVLIVAIGISNWVQYARTVRSIVLVERGRDYVHAARVTGVSSWRIMLHHILPNVMGPVLVIATISLALAIITEATLSFLGVGVPPTQPSLGTLVRIGNEYLFSGDWWISIFPGAMLLTVALTVNVLGDWLRDALNPKLR